MCCIVEFKQQFSAQICVDKFFVYIVAIVSICIVSDIVFIFAQLMSDESNFSQFHLSTFQLGEFMRLDASAAQALNLLPTPTEGISAYFLSILLPNLVAK